MEIFKYKYLKFDIEMIGIQRVETLEYPEDALREAILNALIHRNYQSSDSIQIKIKDSAMNIWSPGSLHPEITIDMLNKTHPSKPNNKLIADICYKAGLIESWGKGTKSIIDSMRLDRIQLSEIKEFAGGIQVDFLKANHTTAEVTAEVELLRVLDGEMSSQELIKKLNLKHAEHFRKAYLKEALNNGLVEMTIPDKPKSSKQKYRITEKGKKLI